MKENEQLDRRVPFAFYLAGQVALGLGEGIKDYPIASGAVILGQVLALGVELNAATRGISIDAQLDLFLHIEALRTSIVAGIVGEVGYRLIRSLFRIEKARRNGQLPDDPTIGDIRDIVNPDKE